MNTSAAPVSTNWKRCKKISDAPLLECPACSQPGLVKKVSAAAFRLSGSGWYETDFKSGNKKNLAGDAGAGAKKDSADNSTAKTDKKVDTTTAKSAATSAE